MIDNKIFYKKYNEITEKELIELMLYILDYKTPSKKAEKLLSYYGNVSNMIQDIIGIPKNTKLKLLCKLMNNYSKYNIYNKIIEGDIIKSPEELYDYYVKYRGNNFEEKFDILYLDNVNKIITFKEEASGTLDHCLINIRSIVKQALSCNASNLVIFHNHPSGYIEPSSADIFTTKKLSESLSNFDIKILDHIIVGKYKYCSMKIRGLL